MLSWPEKLELARQSLPAHCQVDQIDALDRGNMQAYLEGLGPVDHVFSTIGTFPDEQGLKVEDASLRGGIESRFWSAVYLVRDCVGSMSADGSFVFMSGTGNWRPEGAPVASSSLGALETLVRGLAVQHAPKRFNCVAPGFTRTPFVENLFGDTTDQVLAEVAKRIPLGRPARPAEVADAVVFLMANGYVNGISLVVDGGYLLT